MAVVGLIDVAEGSWIGKSRREAGPGCIAMVELLPVMHRALAPVLQPHPAKRKKEEDKLIKQGENPWGQQHR